MQVGATGGVLVTLLLFDLFVTIGVIVDLCDVIYYDVVVYCLSILRGATARLVAGPCCLILTGAEGIGSDVGVSSPGIGAVEWILLGLPVSCAGNLSVVAASAG